MYLKSIEIQGFKSFANKTLFEFHNGVTGIVGPNGSGKSNVADAVRWVLGEQRVKQLRGGNMQDVIFAGTQNRKPLGYASVSITLDNTDHALPVSFDEVTVTRRLYRSGESEYKLNGTACRLRDIQEIFYDTGIGKEGYSIIGQGQIEKILNGKPEERRELFDEAVGIVKYKRRKMQAVKKLQDEQQNLVRVNDILSELTRQVGPLERQSEKAKIYLEKKDQLKSYEVNLFLEEYLSLKAQLEETLSAQETAKAHLEEAKQKSEQMRTLYEEESARIEELESKKNALQEQIAASQLAKGKDDGQIALLTERIRVLHENEQERQERIARAEEQIKAKQENIAALDDAAKAMAEEIARLREQKQEEAQKSGALAEQQRVLGEKLEEAHKQALEIISERSGIEAAIQRNEALKEQLGIRKAEVTNRILRLRSDESDQSGTLERLSNEHAAIDREIDELQAKSEAASSRLQKIQEEVTGYSQRMESGQQEFHRAQSRLETMRNIAERYDGYGNSIRRVMEQKASNPGLHGVVADLIKTEKKYETAIETALGGSIQHIVTDGEDTAKRMIAFLKNGRFGRATFLPLTAMRHSAPFNQTGALREAGVIGLASDLVRADERYEALVRNLLGRTVVADNIDSAIALARKYRYGLRIVTLEGDLLSPGGSMSGGAFKNSSNLLGRRREIEELTRQVQTSREALLALKTKIDQGKETRNALRDEIRALSEQLQRKFLEQNTAVMEQREIEKRSGQTGQAFRQLQEELTQITLKLSQIDDEMKRLEEDERESIDREDAQSDVQAQLSADQEACRAQMEQAARALEQINVQLSANTQKAGFLQTEQERFRQECAELRQEQTLLGQQEETDRQEQHLQSEIQALQEKIKQDDAQRDKDTEALQALQAESEDKKTKQKAFFDEREKLAERQQQLDRENYRLESLAEKLESSRESKIAYMWEEYELTYGKALELKRDDLGDRAQWQRRMGELKKQIKDLGHVNVDAIEEYREVAERHQFMTTQHEDLIKAEQALQKIISELDEGMRAQFKENFARIQEEFDKAFRQLFGGGKGTLELADGEDVLEAGIRIIAQPPGKKLQNMMQLSGGEKALAAIALLFAIQNLKPSPFCLLDEIEAALDERNVERYAGYLHKLTKHTQFIIITHRRGTMAAADRLYGVTMQEKGVSALVSVNLIEGQLDG